MTDRARTIFGNEIAAKDYRQACRAKEKYLRRFGADNNYPCVLESVPAPAIGASLGVQNLIPAPTKAQQAALAHEGQATSPSAPLAGNAVLIGNIRMGFGHYRIAIAMASAAHALGYTPYWLDFCGFPETLATKIILDQNRLYSLGSRLSQQIPPFNKLVWEPLNSEGFKQLSYNAQDQKVAELFTAPLRTIPKNTPFVATHAWCAQAAVHAGFTHVVNAIPDNWPMALHLAEGSMHTVQTPFALEGYRVLNGMDKKRSLQPMPEGSIAYTGHYIDHELVANIEPNCRARIQRREQNAPVRYLLTVGGAGAQQNLFQAIIEHLLPLCQAGTATLLINVGDHKQVWNGLVARIPALAQACCHFGNFNEVEQFAKKAATQPLEGIHAFYDAELFSAVYSTNVLMPICDVLVTKPSELAFYPVPKLLIRRVGGHEAYGAKRSAEVGDGTLEMESPEEICAMIDALQNSPEIIVGMCKNIMAEATKGTYRGAYQVVKLATGQLPSQ